MAATKIFSVVIDFLFVTPQLTDLIRCIDGIKYMAESKKDPVFESVLCEWSKIEEITNILQIPFIVTKTIQSPALALSDFYGCWLRMRIDIEALIQQNHDQMGFAQTLLNSLNGRKSQLLNHPAMLSAVFLDPRYHFDLTEEEKQFARFNLRKIWHRIVQFKTRNTTHDNNSGNDEVDKLEKYLADKWGPLNRTETVANGPNFYITDTDLMKCVEEYENNLPRIHHSKSILDYWSGRLDESKHIAKSLELQYLASTILAIPSTQVPCERSFSVLNHVFDPHRGNIEPKLLEAILFIRMNRGIFQNVKAEDRRNILKEME